MDWEEKVRDLMKSGAGKDLQSLMNSEAGERLAKTMDGSSVERAAKNGNAQELAAILKNVLSTPEGKAFAEQVRKTVKNGQ